MLKTYYVNTPSHDAEDYEIHIAGCPHISEENEDNRLVGVFFQLSDAISAARLMGYEAVIPCVCCKE